MKAVDDVGEIQLQIQGAFGGRHHFQFLGRLHHVLPLFTVADQIAFDVVGAVVFPVFGQHAFHFFFGLEVVVGENAGPGRKRAQPENISGVHQILVGEHVVGSGLHIQPGGDAVSEIRKERPVLSIENAAADFEPVRVGIDKSRGDGFPAHVKHFGAGWNAAPGADARDAIVFDDHVGVLEHFVALHGDNRRAAQHDGALGSFARKFQVDGDFLDVFFLFLEFLRLLLFFLFVFFGIGGLFFVFIFVGVLGVAVFLVAVFFLVFGRLKGNRTEGLAEIACAHGPGDGFAVVSPAKIVRANVSNFFEWHRSAGDTDRGGFAPHRRHGQHEKLIHDVRENPLAVGAGYHVVGGNRLFKEIKSLPLHLQMGAAVGSVVAQRNEAGRSVNIDAIFFGGEMGAAGAARGKN